MAVRTAEIAHGVTLSASTTTVIYTVPAGKTAVIKDVVLLVTGGSSGGVSLAWRRSGVVAYVTAATLGAGGLHVSSSRFSVGEPGDELLIFDQLLQTSSFHVSGAILDGVA